MKKIPTVLMATIWGIAIESTLCVISVISVLFGGLGPCGPTGNAPAFVRVIHEPGLWLAGFFVEDSSPLYLLLAVVVTTVFLSILAFIVLSFGVGRSETHQTATVPEPTATPANPKAVKRK